MTDYYAEQLALAEAFDDYLVRRLVAEGHPAHRHLGRAAQLAHGDLSICGVDVEVKFDQLFHTTGNLFIEIAEKREASRVQWTSSGIFSGSAAPWYGIGDYRDWFVLSRAWLKRLVPAPSGVITIGRGTSRGFLLPTPTRSSGVKSERHWRDYTALGALIYDGTALDPESYLPLSWREAT